MTISPSLRHLPGPGLGLRRFTPLGLLSAVVLATLSVQASTLTLVPLLYNGAYGEYQMEGRAITPDGAFVVGALYKSNTVYNAWMDGFFYNVTNNTVLEPSSSGMQPAILTGVAYRTDGGQKQLVCDGISGEQADWMTIDGGSTWGAKRRTTAWTVGKDLPIGNSLGATTASGTFYTIIGDNPTDLDNERNLYIIQGSGTWNSTTAPTVTQNDDNIQYADGGHFTAVAATGRAVGWYHSYTNNQRWNYVVNFPPPAVNYFTNTWEFHGLDNTMKGEAWAVSADGTKIFGHSPTATDVNWHGYKAVVTSAVNSLQRVDPLPDFSNTAGSGNLALPYGCSADGRYAVGMNYRGVERAVLWDTGNANPTNWTVVDLTDVAAAEGLLGSSPNPRWIALTRAYAVGTNAAGVPVVTGYGYYFDGVNYYNRAFVMTVSPCASVPSVGGISSPVYDSDTTVAVTGCNPAATVVSVYQGGTLIGSAPAGTPSVVVTVAPPSLVAGWVLKATQTVNGQESCLNTAPSVTVTTAANPPPVVTLTAPANNTTLVMPASIGLAATVTSNFNTIKYVAFYNWGTNLVATVSVPPYAYSWANVSAGIYSLSAVVGYNSGSSTNSATSLVTVNPPSSGSALAAIPLAPWQSGENQNQGSAISPDGKYVAGSCYTSTIGDGDGFFYDVVNGTVIQPSASSHPDQQYPPNILTGIGYRTDPIYGKQLVLDGMTGGYQANWSTTDGGLTWGAIRTDNSFTLGAGLPTANSLGAVTGSDKFYTIIGNYPQDINNQRVLFTCKGSGSWSSSAPCSFAENSFNIDNPDAGAMNGVAAATGRAVGYYRDAYLDNGNRHNYVVDYPPAGPVGYPQSYVGTWPFAGLDGTVHGEAWSVSADGRKIFGRSPTPTDSNWHGYKAVVTSATNSLQSIAKLPDFLDTSGSTRLATPYGCTADGRYAVGMNYRGRERAVLWDTGDANPANWTVTDLTDFAAGEGMLGNFAGLSRALSVGTNSAGNPVVTGFGSYFDGTAYYNRAFVMVVGTPRPRLTAVTGAGTSRVTVSYTNTIAGKTYTLQYSTNFSGTVDWYPVSSKAAARFSDSQTDNSAVPGERLYRVYTP